MLTTAILQRCDIRSPGRAAQSSDGNLRVFATEQALFAARGRPVVILCHKEAMVKAWQNNTPGAACFTVDCWRHMPEHEKDRTALVLVADVGPNLLQAIGPYLHAMPQEVWLINNPLPTPFPAEWAHPYNAEAA